MAFGCVLTTILQLSLFVLWQVCKQGHKMSEVQNTLLIKGVKYYLYKLFQNFKCLEEELGKTHRIHVLSLQKAMTCRHLSLETGNLGALFVCVHIQVERKILVFLSFFFVTELTLQCKSSENGGMRNYN